MKATIEVLENFYIDVQYHKQKDNRWIVESEIGFYLTIFGISDNLNNAIGNYIDDFQKKTNSQQQEEPNFEAPQPELVML